MTFEQIIEVVNSVGLWIFFAWLYMQERTAHELTRQKWSDDLREIAGLRRNLTVPDSGSSLSTPHHHLDKHPPSPT